MWKRFSIIGGIGFCLVAVALGNPVSVDPVQQASLFGFGFVLAICVAIETCLLKVFCRVFQQTDCEVGMTAAFAVLNVLSWFLVLMPVMAWTESVVLAEILVVGVEAVGIWKIFSMSGVGISFRRALEYSFCVNLISFFVGVILQ